MSKTAKLLFMAFSVQFLLSCGEGHESKAIVKDFMKRQMSLDDYDIIRWSELKDTYFVSDSMVNVLRKNAELAGKTKQGVKYAAPTDRLRFIQVDYTIDEDTVQQTFYLDDHFRGVVCFK